MRPLVINLLTLRRSRAGGAETYATELVPRVIDRWPGPSSVLVRADSADWLAGLGWQADSFVPVNPHGKGSASVMSAGLSARRVVRRSAGVVFSPFNTHTVGAARASELVGLQDLLTFHYLAGTWGPLPIRQRALLRVKARALADATSKAGAVVVHTEVVRRDLLRFVPRVDPSRIHLVHLGADHGPEVVPTTAAPEEDTKPVVLLVGSSMLPHKNLGLAMDMARTAAFAATGARLVIVGREVPALPGDLDSQVDCRQNVSDAELEELYRSCSCLLFPSAAEGFGLPLVEAMRRGVPCVVSDTEVFRELAGEAAEYFDPRSPDAAARAVAGVLADRGRRDALRRAGPTRAESFTWDRSADGYVAAMCTLI